MPDKGILIVLSGPSGVGKNTVLSYLLKQYPMRYSISATTRAPRPNEVDGRDYFFLSREEFEQRKAAGFFLECAEVYGQYYGTPLPFIRESLDAGHDVILDLDIQGAASVRERIRDAVLIFLLPPSLCELRRRLVDRGTECPSDLTKRLDYVARELAAIGAYDYLVVNDDLNAAVGRIARICEVEKWRVSRQNAARFLEEFYCDTP